MTFKNATSSSSTLNSETSPLKLKAENQEDITIISSLLQDALVPFISMTHDLETHTFCLLTHRFRWEKTPTSHAGVPLYERIHSLVNIQHVHGVKTKGLKDSHDPNHTLNLLCFTFQDNTLILTFSDNIQVQLSIEKMLILMEDQNISWPTPHKPNHPA